MVRGRFAPIPSGRMHLGNVFSALLAWLSAKSKGGQIVLRVEDLDPGELRKVWSPEKVIGLLAWRCGLTERWETVSPRELAADFDWRRVCREDIVMTLPQ